MKSIGVWNDAEVIAKGRKTLQNNGIIASSTDTVFGLLAPLTQLGYDKLNEIKNRVNKPYLILIHDKSNITAFADMPKNDTLQKIIATHWPGPLTIIFRARDDLPAFMRSPDGTVALRMPDHAGLQKLLADCAGLFSTSANISGEPIPENADQVNQSILEKADLVIDDEYPAELRQPSTIIDATGDEIRVIRRGAIHID